MDEKNFPMQRNVRYQIIEEEDGIFLKVWPAADGEVEVEETEILQELEKRNISKFKAHLISLVLNNKLDQVVDISDSLKTIDPKQYLSIRIRRDRMEAVIEVKKSLVAAGFTIGDLLDELQASGIVFGIEGDALLQALMADVGCKITCARGVDSCKGEDAYLKYHVDLKHQGQPVERADGSSDLKNIRKFFNVSAGDLLVEKIPATDGVAGIDVLGLPVPAKVGRDVVLRAGKNTMIVDSCRLVAAIDGQLHIKNGKIQVLPLLEIKEDVDYSTGNIDFVGSVLVRGSVQCGFSVKAAGNVEIYGNIGGGMVEASQIIVHKGIQGMNRSIIKAREWIEANFIENATVYADQKVLVRNVIMNSQIFAGIAIIVEGKRGLVVGGRLSAGQEIRVKTAGNLANVSTELNISGNPFLNEEVRRLRLALKSDNVLYQEMEQAFAYFCKQKSKGLPLDRQALYEKMQQKHQVLSEKISDMQERVDDIEQILSSLEPGKIYISHIIYPGARVAIGPLRKQILDALQYLTMYVHDEEIRFTSLK